MLREVYLVKNELVSYALCSVQYHYYTVPRLKNLWSTTQETIFRMISIRCGVEDPTFEAKANSSKIFEAKDRLFEDSPCLDLGQEWSRPRAKDQGHNFFKIYGRQIFYYSVFKILHFR